MQTKNKALTILIALAVFVLTFSFSLWIESLNKPEQSSASANTETAALAPEDIVTREDEEHTFSKDFLGYLNEKYPGKRFALTEEKELVQVMKNAAYTLFFVDEDAPEHTHVGGVYIDDEGKAEYKDSYYAYLLQEDFEKCMETIVSNLNIYPSKIECYINSLHGKDEDQSITAEQIAFSETDYEQSVYLEFEEGRDCKEAVEKLHEFVKEHKLSGVYSIKGDESYSFLTNHGSSNGIHKY